MTIGYWTFDPQGRRIWKGPGTPPPDTPWDNPVVRQSRMTSSPPVDLTPPAVNVSGARQIPGYVTPPSQLTGSAHHHERDPLVTAAGVVAVTAAGMAVAHWQNKDPEHRKPVINWIVLGVLTTFPFGFLVALFTFNLIPLAVAVVFSVLCFVMAYRAVKRMPKDTTAPEVIEATYDRGFPQLPE